MKHLVRFSLYEEVNPKDISFIESELDNYFTVAFEFEIETKDTSNIKTKFELSLFSGPERTSPTLPP